MADDIVHFESLRRWSDLASEDILTSTNTANDPSLENAKFKIDHDINAKIALWQGRIWTLDVDCIVNSTNEDMNDPSGVSGAIFTAGGSQLEEECYSLEGCRTGEAKSTRGYNLPCRRVIHTVGPRYNTKYKTAAESALHNCYRHCMEVMVEHKQRSIALCCVYTERKGYPREAAAHIAIRTIRRFLEKHGENVDCLIFCVDNAPDCAIYNKLLPWYFPRTSLELKNASKMLTDDIGDEMGGPVNPERDIRVAAFPAADIGGGSGNGEGISDLIHVEEEDDETPSWTTMRGDPDATRAATSTSSNATPDPVLEAALAERQYDRLLRRAKGENLSDIAKYNFIYASGQDDAGRPIVVIIGRNFPIRVSDLDRVIMYILLTMDHVVNRDYAVVYVHTNCGYSNQPPLQWIKKLYGILQRKYKKNLKKFSIIHPSLTIKTVQFFVKPFVSAKVWAKVNNFDRLADVWRSFSPSQLVLPDWVQEHDATLAPPTTSWLSAWTKK